MGERFYLRTMSDIGPMWYAGADNMGELWSSTRDGGTACDDLASIRGLRAALCSESGRDRSAVRIVRVGPPRRYTLTEKGRAATEQASQRVDGTPDGDTAVPSLAARPEGSVAELDPGGFQVGDVWTWPGWDKSFTVESVNPGGSATVRMSHGRRTGIGHYPGMRLVSRAGKPWPPVAEPAPKPERVPVTGTWCADSPVHEHAWQWRDGGLVCAHCGGRRVEAKA